jgi:Lon protease-like protein
VVLVCLPGSLLAQTVKPDTSAEAGTLPSTIPIFPLQDVMLFPHVSRPLLIFEPRYRAMVADALKGDRIIGMVLLRPGYESDYEGRPPVYPIGCAGVITEATQLPDGRYTIVLRGLAKFRVTGEDQSRPYRLAKIQAMPETLTDEDKTALRTERQRLVSVLKAAMAPGSDLPPATIPDEDLVNAVSQYLDIEPIDRQDLLERNGALLRVQALIALLEK